MAWAVRGRSSAVFGPSVSHGPIAQGLDGRKAIALTFDDGPSPGTSAILEVLARYNARATFFQCGVNVERTPGISVAVRVAGHEIGNHSHTHPNFALRSARTIASEFSRAQRTIATVTGVAPSLLRAPYGVRWFGFREMQRRLNLLGVMWTVDRPRLYPRPPPRLQSRQFFSGARDGAIVCLHDGRGTLKDPCVDGHRRSGAAYCSRIA